MIVIGLFGEKQSGKSSAARFISNELSNIKIDSNDNMQIPAYTETTENIHLVYKPIKQYTQNPEDLILAQKLWKDVKIYNFADNLKLACHIVYQIPLELLYGTDEQKNTPTHILWGNLPIDDVNIKTRIKKLNLYETPMTVREVMQYFATICRKMDPTCFITGVKDKITKDRPKVAIIGDGRLVSEHLFTMMLGATNVASKLITIRFKLPNDTQHDSELELSSIKDEYFNLVIEKQKQSEQEKNAIIRKLLHDHNILP